MAATVHVVARWLAKPGRENEVKAILADLVAPSRREVDCFQYDLLISPGDPRDFCFVERWASDQALDRHAETAHVKTALERAEGLIQGPPDVRRYRVF